MTNKMIYITVAAFALAGCSTVARFTANLPIPLSAIRSPITIKKVFWPRNGRLDEADRGILNCAAQIVVSDRSRSRDAAWNESHRNVFCKNSPLGQNNPFDTFDTFHDLCEPESQGPSSSTLLLVAISGGGARATALASHALAILEQKYNAYNRADLAHPGFLPFIDRIAAFSTVSGGSVYSYQAAVLKTLWDDAQKTIATKKANGPQEEQEIIAQARKLHQTRANFFTIVDILPEIPTKRYDWPVNVLNRVLPSPEDMGLWTAYTYLNPLGFTLILPLITDTNYLDLLSQGLTLQTAQRYFELTFEMPEITDNAITTPVAIKTFWEALRFNPTTITLADLTPKPRVFFNATILETGLPFVFTQRLTHLPIQSIYGHTARLDLRMHNKSDENTRTLRKLRPLGATTLEDINSSPRTVPASVAAMASAAFPIGLEPLELKKYGYHPSYRSIYPSDDILHVTDGGVYDNSGLATLIELSDFLATSECKTKRIIILSINADAESHDPYYPHRDPAEESFWEYLPVSFGLPIRWGVLGTEALARIHYTNKRRAEEMAIERMKKITENESTGAGTMGCPITVNEEREGKLGFYYFPISLGQLSAADEYRLPDPSNLYERLQKIPTDYYVSKEESTLLAQAAKHIIEVEQPKGWCVNGQEDNKRLGDALVESLGSGNKSDSRFPTLGWPSR